MERKKIIIILFWVTILFIPLSFIMRMCSDTSSVIEKEFSATSLLKKYEYFKDLSASIDEKRATIDVYRSQIQGIKDQESFQYQQSQAEMMGLISMHNRLCSEYNSAMAKFNYSFCNKGTLPETNLQPLPREMKPYILSIN